MYKLDVSTTPNTQVNPTLQIKSSMHLGISELETMVSGCMNA